MEIKYSKWTTPLLLGVQLFIVVIFSIYMYAKAVLDAPVMLFWVLFTLIIFLTTITILKSQSHKYQMISLILLLISILAIKIIGRSELYQMVGTDDFFECGYANTIINSGYWDPTAGLGIAKSYYGYYPAIHLFLSSMSIIFNVDVFIVGKYIFVPLTTIIQFLLVYLIVSNLFKDYKNKYSVTALIMLLYLSTIGVLIIHISRRTYADMFVLLALFCLTQRTEEDKDFKYIFVFLVSITMIVMGHHLSTYISLFLFGCLFLLAGIYKIRVIYSQKWVFFILAIVVGYWFICVAPKILLRDFSGMISLWTYFLTKPQDAAIAVMSQYHPIEKILIYISQGLFILLSILGFFVLLKYHKSLKISQSPKFLLMFFAVSGLMLYVITGPLIQTRFFFVPMTLMLFTGIGMSILFVTYISSLTSFDYKSSTRVKRKEKIHMSNLRGLKYFCAPNFEGVDKLNPMKIVIVIFLIAIIFSGNILITFSARYINRAQDEDLTVEDQRNLDDTFYTSGLWLQSHSLSSDRVVSDLLVYQFYAGYLSIDAIQDWRFFVNETVFNDTFQLYDYVVFDKNLMRYPSIISGEPIGTDVISRYDNNNVLDRVYDNGHIFIYRVSK